MHVVVFGGDVPPDCVWFSGSVCLWGRGGWSWVSVECPCSCSPLQFSATRAGAGEQGAGRVLENREAGFLGPLHFYAIEIANCWIVTSTVAMPAAPLRLSVESRKY